MHIMAEYFAFADIKYNFDKGLTQNPMRKLLLVLLLASATYAVASAQRGRKDQPEEPPKSLIQQVSDDYAAFYRNGGVFEKLYLMTDKPYYSAGETIFFSGFLLHATFLTRFSSSEFIYVELISPEGRLVQREKIAAENRQFVGTLSLSPRLAAGRYTLRAYSRWMTNFDTGYFYVREVNVGNYIDDAVQISVSYEPDEKGVVTATARFIDQYSMPLASQQVRYRTVVGGRSRSATARTDDKGCIEIRFRPSDDPGDCFEFDIRANDRELSRFVQMPSFSDDFDVAFCPEGGSLIGGKMQIVAFKAIRGNGRSVGVEGKVFDADGTFLTDFSSEHKGMGRFLLRPEAGHSYYAECTSASGLTKRFELPAVEPSGATLRVLRRAGGHMFIVEVTPDLNIADFAAVVHSRGAVMSVIEDLSHPSRIRNSDMFDGIAQISVVHKPTRRIVAERLFYVRDNRMARASVSSDKEGYAQRERVMLTLDVNDSEGRPAAGNFAMSVTDANYVTMDGDAPNILSYLLLSSDLKGEVEDAGSYFADDSEAMLGKLDLVMLTNGWRRYSLEDVFNHEYPRIMYPVEDSQRIIGSVFGLFGRARKPSIVVMEPKSKYVESFELNEANNFIISGLEAFSTTTYIVQALNKKGRDTTVRIKIESENYPVATPETRREFYREIPQDTIPQSFLSRAKERYFYEGGERIVDIEEIVVTARRRTTPFFSAGNTGTMLNGDLSRFATVYDALATFKELDVIGTTVTTLPKYVDRSTSVQSPSEFAVTQGGEGEEDLGIQEDVGLLDDDMRTPELYVNGNISSIDALDSYDTRYIERLAFVDGRGAYMLGLSAPSGAIMMEVSKEGLYTTTTSDAMARVVVRGCQKPEEFYKPKYTTEAERIDARRDMRSTIAWEPLIRTDSTGHAAVWFYTADLPGTYDVVLEGVTDEGEPCRLHRTLEVGRR